MKRHTCPQTLLLPVFGSLTVPFARPYSITYDSRLTGPTLVRLVGFSDVELMFCGPIAYVVSLQQRLSKVFRVLTLVRVQVVVQLIVRKAWNGQGRGGDSVPESC